MNSFYQFTIDSLKKAGWAPLGVFIVHVIMTMGFNAYDYYPILDIPMHFLGGVAICFFYFAATNAQHAEQFSGHHTKFSKFILLTALTGLTTVFWEFAEWVADTYFGQTAQLGVNDTMFDMFLGLAGGMIVGAVFSIKHQPKE